MYLTWRRRLNQSPVLWDFGQWPIIDQTSIPSAKRRLFLRNRAIVIQVLNHQKFSNIAKEFNISASLITHLMNRCLAGDDLDEPPLTKALIPHRRVRHGMRRIPLPTFQQPSGAQHAFTALLEQVPNLKEKLDAAILAWLRDARRAQNLTPARFHEDFKHILVEAGHPTNQYPYTTQNMAAETLRCYFHQRTAVLRAQHQRRVTTPTSCSVNKAIYRAGRTIQIDEHCIDLHNGIQLMLNDELIPLRISRVHLLVATNVDTDCVMGYHLALSDAPNQQDMLQLLENCVRTWRPMTLTTPGFHYEPGACFPSGLPHAFPISFSIVQLDNALAHLAHSVQRAICDQQAATVSMGIGGSPTVRRWIEDVFNLICRSVTHRFSSTTGSHPKDPVKESKQNAKRLPPISLQTLDEAISLVLTRHNLTAKKHLGSATPLELYQSHCRKHYVRYVPEALRDNWKPFTDRKIVRVKWLTKDNRQPHINFAGVRYRGDSLVNVAPKHADIEIEFDRRDIRWLQAWTLDGENLGTLAAPHSWLRFRHSLATRQMINKLVRKEVYHGRDPLAAHFRYLLENRNNKRFALEVVRVYDEYNEGLHAPLLLSPAEHANENSCNASSNGRYQWSPERANHRGYVNEQ